MPIDRSSEKFSADVFAQMTQYPAGQIPKELALEALEIITQRAQTESVDLGPCLPILGGTFAAFPFAITATDLAGIGISVPPTTIK